MTRVRHIAIAPGLIRFRYDKNWRFHQLFLPSALMGMLALVRVYVIGLANGREMKAKPEQYWFEDFTEFCMQVDVRAVIAAADEEGNAPGQSKQIYAIAMVRALEYGDLGENWHEAHSAISMLWERGHLKGFNTDSFNSGLKELQKTRTRSNSGEFSKPVELYSKAVHRR